MTTISTMHFQSIENGLSLDDYDRIIGRIHDGALETEYLSEALEELRGLFQANYVTLILRIPGVEDVGLMLVAGDIEGSGKVIYSRYLHSDTPFSNMPADRVFTVDDVMSFQEWESCAYYRDYSKLNDVYHVMGADISTADSGVLRFRITRGQSQPAFTESDKALCSRLVPHLRRSVHVHNLLGRSASLGNLYAEAVNRLSVATLVLDETGSVLQLNDVARDLLGHTDGLKLVGSRLEASYPSDNRELHKLIRDAVESKDAPQLRETREALSIARPSGEVSLGVVVEPIPGAEWAEGRGQPAVMVYIRDAVGKSQVDNRVAKELFNFTPAETMLALQLANGLSLEEAAENLGIMRNTARAHLRAIFSKTGVRRQAELVRVMLNSVVSLGRGNVTPLGNRATVIAQPQLRSLQSR
ncbi:helix-turn-helix transcriptional regulator [Halopseudomonas sp. SMJS2]|uniref:helix-turn-helix transcriptional regulator n=1 Tax=Halopseudomonas sp. SMJS2 TaxID=3041098 RepID=UPI0024532785|nr:helix-turn-helix transcriptional regulator [Halopseudomonas sp. SMJS2]WGK60884.1 helix-turn-helix transcriptional regulator [Halopseudomonas sp. SMJS2]